MLAFLQRRWFLLSLIATLVVAMAWSSHWVDVAELLPKEWIIGSVLLAMALPLSMDTIWGTIRHPLPAVLAVSINFLVVPLLAWGVSGMLDRELALGLIIAASVPCTLASAAVWTRLAGGNDAVSMLVTMITNLSCFLVTPALIYLLAGNVVEGVAFGEMARKLLLLIVLPIIVAQLLRLVPTIAEWVSSHGRGLSVYCQLGVLSIVFVGAVRSGLRLAEMESQLATILGGLVLMLVLVGAVHLAAWWLGYWVAARVQLGHAEQVAVAFSGSQKTLMVGLAVALQFGGLTLLPMLAYHVEQLVIDTFLADRLRHKDTHPS